MQYIREVQPYVKKYGTIKISKRLISGEIKIVFLRQNKRVYNFQQKISVGVEFRGKITTNRHPNIWYSYENLPELSKIKVYRYIRQHIFEEINDYLRIFDINLLHYSNIRTFKWVG